MKTAVAALAIGLSLAPLTVSALTIDDFSTDQTALVVNGASPTAKSSVSTGGGDILGFERDIHIEVPAGLNPAVASASVEFGRFLMDNNSDANSVVTFQWDGADNSDSLAQNLPTVDLTDGFISNAIEIRFLFDDLPSTLEMTVWSGADSSTVTWPGPALLLTAELSLYIPFDAFIGSADFTNVTAIELSIASPTNGLDLSIDYIQTTLVPVPPALLLFATSLLGLAMRRR